MKFFMAKTAVIKRTALSVLAFALMLSAIPFEPVKAASSINKQSGKAYAEIIRRYMQAFETVKNDPKAVEIKEKSGGEYCFYYNGKWMDDVNYWFIFEVQYMYAMGSGHESPTYKIMDFNKDGVPEMFIGLSEGTIYDLYVFKNGKAVQLIQNMGSRTALCTPCKNKIIAEHSSGAFANLRTVFHKISDSGKLTDVMILSMDNDCYTKTKNGRIFTISKAEYNRIWQKYAKPVKMTFYEADSRAVETVRNGEFFYKGQKKFSVNFSKIYN